MPAPFVYGLLSVCRQVVSVTDIVSPYLKLTQPHCDNSATFHREERYQYEVYPLLESPQLAQLHAKTSAYCGMILASATRASAMSRRRSSAAAGHSGNVARP